MKRSSRSFRSPLILAASCALLLAPLVHAQTATGWTGGGGDALWNNPANWDNGAPPGVDTNIRSLFFGNAFFSAGGAGVTTAQNNLVGYNGHRITFEDTAAPTDPAFTLSGAAFTLFDFGGNAPRIENQSSVLQTFGLGGALTLNGGALDFAEINPVNGDLLFSNALVLAGATQLRVFGDNAKTVSFNGVISGATAANSVAINQNSNVVYGAVNTYAGDTFINAGSLSFQQGGGLSAGTLQLGDTAATTAAATLRIGDADGGTTIARPIVVRAGSTGLKTIAVTNTAGINTFSGTILLNDHVTLAAPAGGALTLSGAVSGTKTVTKSGAGIVTLSAANSFSGGLVIDAGTVRPTAANTVSGGILINTGGTLETTTTGADSGAYTNFFGAPGNPITFNGGRLLDSNAVDRTVTNRPLIINENGGIIEVAGTFTNFAEGTFTQLRFATAAPVNPILTGSGTVTKNGGGRLTLNSGSSPDFSGAWVINNGTFEVLAVNLGNASATNTVLLNGGNLASSGTTIAQAVTLNGGALSGTGGNRVFSGPIDVTAGSYFFLNDFWRDFDSAAATSNIGRTLNHTGLLTGDDALGVGVNRAAYRFNNGSLVLQNPANTYSGTITVGKNLRLENNPTGGVGNALGTASIVLADGGLNLRDNGGADNGSVAFGNNLAVIAPTDIFDRGTLAGAAVIDVNRTTSGTFTGNTLKLGSLTIGGRVLNVTGGNGYGLEFGGLSQIAGNATINATTAPVTFSGGLNADVAGRTLTKTGAAALIFSGETAFNGAMVVNGGALTLSGLGALTGPSSLTVNSGATLAIDNSAGNLSDRVANTVPINLNDATLSFTSLVGDAVNTSETLGAVTLLDGASTIIANQGNPLAISALTLTSLTRQNDATVTFVGTNLGQVGNTSRIILADRTVSGVLPSWMTINGSDFAQYLAGTDGGFVRGVTAIDYLTDPADDSGFNTTQNLRLTGATTTTLTANRALSTVNFANQVDTRTLDLAGHTLTLANGGIIVGANAAAITGAPTSGLTSGLSELFITNNAPLTISAPIRDNGGSAVSVIKSGVGVLTLSGLNTFTGDLSISQGAFTVTDVANVGLASQLGAGGALRLSSEAATTLLFTGASDATDRALVVGATGATFDITTAETVLSWNGAVSSAGALSKEGPGALTFGGTPVVTGPVTVSAGSLSFGGATTLNGPATVSGGSLSFGGTTTVNGPANVSVGTLSLAGTTTVDGAATVFGGGTLNIAGAAIITGDLNVGNGTTGPVVNTNGAVTSTSGSLSVGSGAANAINIGGETVGTTANTTGNVNLSNLASFTANVGAIRIGVEGPGANGTGVNTGVLVLALDNTITASTSILVGDSGGNGDLGDRGTLSFGAGINDVTTPLLTIGGRKYGALSNIASGGALLLDNGAGRTVLNVGVNVVADTGTIPSATFDLSGGTVMANLSNVIVGQRSGGGATGKATGVLNLGSSANTVVDVNVSASSALRIGILDYGSGAKPTNEQANGTVIIGGGVVNLTSTNSGSSAVIVGHFNNFSGAIDTPDPAPNNSATGVLTIDGGAVTIVSAGASNAINLGPRSIVAGALGSNTANGTLNINGGSLTVNNQIAGNSTVAGSTSTLNLTGGLLNMQAKNLTNINNLNFSGGTLRNLGTLNRALTQTGESSLLDVVANNSTISGAYALTDGDLSVAATRTLNVTGGTTLGGSSNALINGSLNGSLVTVNAGATLGGSGTVTNGLTLAGGLLAPGNGLGILTSNGALTLNGGVLALELNGTVAGAGHDQLNVTGIVNITAPTSFTLSLGYVPAIGDAFTIINNDLADAVVGLLAFNGGAALADEATFTTAQGYEFRIDYNGGSGNDVRLITTIPEPGSLLSLLGGFGLLTGLQRLRRRRA